MKPLIKRDTILEMNSLITNLLKPIFLIGFLSTLCHASTSGVEKGIEFPSNGDGQDDVRFRFTGENLLPMYPATYIWKINLRRQSGYYTTFFWGPDGPFTGASYYGAHPYPDGEPKHLSTEHKWELSINGGDKVEDENGNSTQLGYNIWRTQALRVFDDGKQKVHEFYWDLPDTNKVIKVVLDQSYGKIAPINPALTFGDAPWSIGRERLSGILRGIQLYSVSLSKKNILQEINSPQSTSDGKAEIWYLNLDPQPNDISDQSGKEHHPVWVSGSRPKAWISQPTGIFRRETQRNRVHNYPFLKWSFLGRFDANKEFKAYPKYFGFQP